MERTVKERKPRTAEYWYIGHHIEDDALCGTLEVRCTHDEYFWSDDLRWQVGNYFGSPQDAQASIEEYRALLKKMKEEKDHPYGLKVSTEKSRRTEKSGEDFVRIKNYLKHGDTLLRTSQIRDYLIDHGCDVEMDEKSVYLGRKKDVKAAVAAILSGASNTPLVTATA